MDNYLFQVEPFSEDVTGRLSWGVLGNMLLRVAEKSAITHGFGYDVVHAENKAWVLSRLLIEMPKMPATGAAFKVTTWVESIYRTFTNRLFQISDASDNSLGFAKSVWALIDLDTRQPVNLTKYRQPEFQAAMSDATIDTGNFSRCQVSADALKRTIEIGQSDLDINGHVNSIRYLQMAIDSVYLLHKERLDIRRQIPSRIEMTYSAETFYGDTLEVAVHQVDAAQYHVLLSRSDGTAVTRSVVFFRGA